MILVKLIHDCVRDVMLDIENNLNLHETTTSTDIQKRLKKYSLDDIYYTCQKLKEAGYLKVDFFIDGSCCIESMTYNGHQFLDNIRDDRIWKEVKSKISKLASASLPIIHQVASQAIIDKLGL